MIHWLPMWQIKLYTNPLTFFPSKTLYCLSHREVSLQEVELYSPSIECWLDFRTCFWWMEYSGDLKQSDSTWHLRPSHKSIITSSSLFLLDHLLCRRPTTMLENYLNSFGELHMARNWGLLPTAIWVCHLGNGLSSPSQAFRWLKVRLTSHCNLVRDTKLETPR